MVEVIPAILPKDYDDLKDKIAIVRGYASIVQIDICDGIFVKNISWPFYGQASKDVDIMDQSLDQHFLNIINEREGMPFWEDVEFELDLMVSDAITNFDIYTKLGPRRIILHIEAVGNLEEFKHFLEGIDPYIRDSIEIGIAINTTTGTEQIFPLIPSVDFVQLMGIENIGFQGQDFDERVLGQVKILKEKFPDIMISVDGSVNFETAPKLVEAGVERLISGSVIFNSNDIIDTIEQLKNS